MKTCTCCGEEKEISDFHKDKSKKDGLRFWCKVCAYEVSRRKDIRDRETIKEYHRLLASNNKRLKEIFETLEDWNCLNSRGQKLRSYFWETFIKE